MHIIMKKIIPVLFTLSTFIVSSGLQAQPASLKVKAQQYINEVFRDCTPSTEDSEIKDYAERLSRIEIVTLSEYASEDYTLLSQVNFKNKCNPDLQPDNAANFDPSSFNPFKYGLSFFPKSDKAYRVDNTQYIILIHSKQD